MSSPSEKPWYQRIRGLLSLRFFFALALLAACWLVVTEGIAGSWPLGVVVITATVLFISQGGDSGRLAPSLVGSLAYIPFFLHQSVLSGFDVALRAMRPDMGLQPALVVYPLHLPLGSARQLFVNSITLMPGTLSVEVRDETVLVHVLDRSQPVMAALRLLEHRVGAVYGLSLPGGKVAR